MSNLPSLSQKERLVLELLAEDVERYALELVSASGGRLKRGTVYVTLSRMEEKGLVASRKEQESQRLSRRLYKLTELGRRCCNRRVAFCGCGSDKYRFEECFTKDEDFVRVVCAWCGEKGRFAETVEQAVKAWNQEPRI